MLRRKYEFIRAGTKNVAGSPTRATIRRKMEMGSSVGCNLLPPGIRFSTKETNTE